MQITQMMLFKYSKYPNAAKAYLQFMMEPEQYNPWMEAAIGYVSQPLKAYEAYVEDGLIAVAYLPNDPATSGSKSELRARAIRP